MEEIIDSLKKIGLSDKEARVYIALLKTGGATVKEVAAEADIKRPTTYLILEELREKGLVLKVPHAKKAIYNGKSPEELHNFMSENVRSFETSFPKIQAIASKRRPVKTYYFEGMKGIKDALNYRLGELRDEKIIGFWASAKNIRKEILDLNARHDVNYEKQRIAIEGITPDDEETKFFKEKFAGITQGLRLVPPDDYSSDISIEIVKDFVRILDPIEEKAVIIESSRVADTMRRVFELVMRNYKREDEIKYQLPSN